MRSIQKKKIFLIENGEGVESMVNIKKIKQAVSIVLTGTLFITTILPYQMYMQMKACGQFR